MFYGTQAFERTSNLGHRMSRNDYTLTLAEMTFPDFSEIIRKNDFFAQQREKLRFSQNIERFSIVRENFLQNLYRRYECLQCSSVPRFRTQCESLSPDG